MHKYALAGVGFVMLWAALAAQTPPIIGDRTTPLAVSGGDNVGVSRAVLREQPEVRVLRVVVQPNGTRVMHSHDTLKFHLFIPISGPMELNLDGGRSVDLQPWAPYYLKGGEKHGFHNNTAEPVEIMEVFVN